MDYLNIPIGERAPELVNAVVEVPLGGVNKYEYDKQLHVFRLDRTLYSPVHYPGDYGFIPSTLAGDEDPLDVLVLVDNPSFPGCLIEVRPIGLLQMLDQGVRDEKVLAVASNNPRYAEIHSFSDIYPHVLREIEHFFSIYKDLEGKRTTTISWQDEAAAHRIIKESCERFLQHGRRGVLRGAKRA
jgi:inorganic pyrophosphatase